MYSHRNRIESSRYEGRRILVGFTILNLSGAKDPFEEPVPELVEGMPDALDFNQVCAKAKDHEK